MLHCLEILIKDREKSFLFLTLMGLSCVIPKISPFPTAQWIYIYIYSSQAAAAAAKLLQSCLTLRDPIDGSPPGSIVPGILQARTLEWVAIAVSNVWKWKVKVKSLSRVRLLRPHGLQPTRLLHPWDFPGKSTGVGCHCLLQFPGYSLCILSHEFLILLWKWKGTVREKKNKTTWCVHGFVLMYRVACIHNNSLWRVTQSVGSALVKCLAISNC